MAESTDKEIHILLDKARNVREQAKTLDGLLTYFRA